MERAVNNQWFYTKFEFESNIYKSFPEADLTNIINGCEKKHFPVGVKCFSKYLQFVSDAVRL